jgi:branched-chain amino acid transport system substrate-binding protein
MKYIAINRSRNSDYSARGCRAHEHRRVGQRLASAFAVCLVVALVAGCSSSGKKTSSVTNPGSSPTGATGATSTAHGTSIVIGNIGSYTGSESSSIGPALGGIKAWVASVNASGGIDGHPIDMIYKEDNDTPSLGLAEAKELLSDHVVAIVSDWSTTDSVWAPMFEKASIPIIGGGPGAPDSLTNTDYFPAQTSTIVADYGALDAMKQEGVTKFGVPYCAENSQCYLGVTEGKATAPKLGMQLVWNGATSSSSPDLTPQCLAARSDGATGILPSLTTDGIIHFVEACDQQGYDPVYALGNTEFTNQLLSVSALKNVASVQADAPWFDNSTPALQRYHAAMAKYAPGVAIGPASSEAWAPGLLFEAAVAASGSSTVTSSSILNGLYNLHADTLGGFAPPLTFTKGQPADIKCFFIIHIQGGKFSEPQGLAPSCEP